MLEKIYEDTPKSFEIRAGTASTAIKSSKFSLIRQDRSLLKRRINKLEQSLDK